MRDNVFWWERVGANGVCYNRYQQILFNPSLLRYHDGEILIYWLERKRLLVVEIEQWWIKYQIKFMAGSFLFLMAWVGEDIQLLTNLHSPSSFDTQQLKKWIIFIVCAMLLSFFFVGCLWQHLKVLSILSVSNESYWSSDRNSVLLFIWFHPLFLHLPHSKLVLFS